MSKNKNTHEYKNTQEHTKTHNTQHPHEISSFHALGQNPNQRTDTHKQNNRKKEIRKKKYTNTMNPNDTFTSSDKDFPTVKHNTIPIERTSSSVYSEALEAASSFQSSIAMIPVGLATEGW